MTNYEAILVAKYPGARWSMTDNDPTTLAWFDDGTAPTIKELDALWPEVEAALQQNERDAQRRAAYVAEADPLFFKYQRGEATEAEWLAKVAEIKFRYPDSPA